MSISRRDVLVTGGALAAAAAVTTEASPATPRRGKERTYVLVHGGGHGGWCWERVATPLRAAGHRVYTPTLTGLGERSHLISAKVDLDMHITDIVNVLKWEKLNDVILVGHSYGGMVITGVADRSLDRIGHMVYFDAAHPKNGSGLWPAPPAASAAAAPAGGATGSAPVVARPGGGGAALMGARMVDGVELILFPDKNLINGALGVTEPADVAWLMDKLTPQTLLSFTQPLRLQNEEAVHKLPTTDIWRSSVLANLRKSGQPFTWAQNVWEINSTSHNLMITEPKQSTDMFLKIAAM